MDDDLLYKIMQAIAGETAHEAHFNRIDPADVEDADTCIMLALFYQRYGNYERAQLFEDQAKLLTEADFTRSHASRYDRPTLKSGVPMSDDILEEVVDEFKAKGHTPYLAPIGGSMVWGSMEKPLGAISYAHAYAEMLEQTDSMGFRPDYVIHATGSGGTQAGLAVGAKALTPNTKVLGISVSEDKETFSQEVRGLLSGREYHFRAKVTNSTGSDYGDDRIFHTEALSAEARKGLNKSYPMGRTEV